MSIIERAVEVEVPVERAYNQWTQFEEFPRFMEGIRAVRQIDDRHLAWQVTVGGRDKEWVAEITEQVPDQRIAWRSREGAGNAGVVTFHRMAPNRTRIMLQLEYSPEGALEQAGDRLGVVTRRVEDDLGRLQDVHGGARTRDGSVAG